MWISTLGGQDTYNMKQSKYRVEFQNNAGHSSRADGHLIPDMQKWPFS